MTISSTTSRVDYTGNGSVSIFPYTFKVNAKTDLSVIQQDTSGIRTTLVVDVDYLVSGVGADAGGTITLNAGALTTGYLLTIRRSPALTQETSIRNQSTFFPSIHEDEFDALVMIDQSQQDQMDRSLKLPETEVASTALTTLPNVTDRASKFLAFDASGHPIASSGGISPAIPVSSFMQTVLAAASAAAVKLLLLVLPDLFNTYRRPNLVWNSTSRVDVGENTGTANQTSIAFHDGEARSVIEDLTATQVYRSFKSGQTAAWASGTIQGGFRSGVSLTANTWYALYAVKCTKGGETANFVIVGDTDLPIQPNFGTLNSHYGTGGWVYLGMIRVGDNSGVASSILAFKQVGGRVTMSNKVDFTNVQSGAGIKMASTIGSTTTTYVRNAGIGATDIPNVLGLVDWIFGTQLFGTGLVALGDSALAKVWFAYTVSASGGTASLAVSGKDPDDGVRGISGNNSDAKALFLCGWVDSVLSGGPNPQL